MLCFICSWNISIQRLSIWPNQRYTCLLLPFLHHHAATICILLLLFHHLVLHHVLLFHIIYKVLLLFDLVFNLLLYRMLHLIFLDFMQFHGILHDFSNKCTSFEDFAIHVSKKKFHFVQLLGHFLQAVTQTEHLRVLLDQRVAGACGFLHHEFVLI